VVNHHRDVPYRLIHCDGALSDGDPDAGNLLVEGDNLVALKALLPYYAGKVKCIYIDPPYNTGNENWVAGNREMARRSRWQRSGGFVAPRQMAMHDVSAITIVAGFSARRWSNLYFD
jgi:hypothetical protein